MHHPNVRHTLDICDRVRDYAAYFASPETVRAFDRQCRAIKQKAEVKVEEVEEALVDFGRKIAAGRVAFSELVRHYRERLGEHIFDRRLSQETRASYRRYRERGGEFDRLFSGRDAHLFTSEERLEIYQALIGMNTDIRRHVRQAIQSTDEAAFEKRVKELQDALEKIGESQAFLQDLIASESTHARHKEEIRAFLEAIDHRFGFLAKSVLHAHHHHEHERILGRADEWPKWIRERWERPLSTAE